MHRALGCKSWYHRVFAENDSTEGCRMEKVHSIIVAVGSIAVAALMVFAIAGDEHNRMLAFAAILGLLVAYAIWRRAWWMLGAVIVGGIIGLM